jgi:hypothetical protein
MPSIAEQVFARIYTNNEFQGNESRSGWGSDPPYTKRLLHELPTILSKLAVRSLVDAPCGDMYWMRHLKARLSSYIGVDIVPELIHTLKAQAWPPEFHFQVGNIITDILPTADALLCRDCLVHLPFSDIAQATHLFRRAGFRYVIATTYTNQPQNDDCKLGEWRPLDMSGRPFSWGKPLLLFREFPPEDTSWYANKHLGVWLLN